MDPHFEGVIFQTHAAELQRRIAHDFPAWCALDVRSANDYAAGHLPGSRHGAAQALTTALPEGTDRDTEFFIVGAAPGDERVRATSEALRSHGARRVVEFSGGMAEWAAFGFGVESEVA
jgi:rhodanese-related sulfurtransferase